MPLLGTSLVFTGLGLSMMLSYHRGRPREGKKAMGRGEESGWFLPVFFFFSFTKCSFISVLKIYGALHLIFIKKVSW